METVSVTNHFTTHHLITFRIIIPVDLDSARFTILSNIMQQVNAMKTNTPVIVRPVTRLCPAKYND